jgi:hypothetical protein
MINIRHVSHDSVACYLMIWRQSLNLFSTMKKEGAVSSETLVTRYHSEQCHFPEHSILQESHSIHGTRISWLIHKASSSISSTKSDALIHVHHKACPFNSIAILNPTPPLLNSISILSSNLHLHVFILRFLNLHFVWISHFVSMCTCPTYLIILD